MLFTLPADVKAEMKIITRKARTALSMAAVFMFLGYRYNIDVIMKMLTIMKFRLVKALPQTKGLINIIPSITGQTILSKMLCFIICLGSNAQIALKLLCYHSLAAVAR